MDRQRCVPRKWIFWTAILVCSTVCDLLSFTPHPGEAQTVKNSVIKLTREDSGREISLKMGEVFEVALSSPGAAGYLWYFDRLDPEYLEVTGEESSAASGERLMGAPLTMRWRLRAKKEGQTEMEMSLYRPWEGKGKAIDIFKAKIRIS